MVFVKDSDVHTVGRSDAASGFTGKINTGKSWRKVCMKQRDMA